MPDPTPSRIASILVKWYAGVILSLLFFSLPTSNIIKPQIQWNLKCVSRVWHCFCCHLAAAFVLLIFFPSNFGKNSRIRVHCCSGSQDLVPRREVSVSHLLEREKSQDPSQTCWLRNSRCGNQQCVFWTKPSRRFWWELNLRITLLVDLYSAGQMVPQGRNLTASFLMCTDPRVTSKIRPVPSAKFTWWSVVLFTNIFSFSWAQGRVALPCSFEVICGPVLALADIR